MAAELTKISDNQRPVRRIDDDVLARSRIRPGFQGNPFAVPSFPPSVIQSLSEAKIPTMAQDAVLADQLTWAATDPIAAAYAEGIVFLGYSYLSVLAQRAEYRVVSETISSEMTREWIEMKIASGDETKQDKVKKIEDEMDKLNIRHAFRKVAESDGFFGRGHLYLDTGATDDPEELLTDLGNGRSQMSKLKIGPNKNQKLIDVRPVEPVWAYPTNYESIDPLRRDWYKPLTWYVMAREIHHSRFLTFVGREVPDILKPAYAFGGLAMSQMLKPYVDNWLRTRQSVSDLVQNFSVNVLHTNMDATTAVGGEALYARVALFNNIKNNQGTMVIDKDTEEWANVSTPLGGLDSLQAQAQEHMAAIARIPLVKLLGIQPAGLNASSEGELIAFEDWIAAFQELLFRKHLTTIIDLIQLTQFGLIDQDITFEFKPLRQLRPEDAAALEVTKSQARETYFGMGAVDANEIRETLAEDPDSPFQGLDLSKPLPAPPAPPAMPGMPPGPPGPPGMPGAPPAPPGGGAAPTGGGGPGQPPPAPPRGGAGQAPDSTAPFGQALTQALNGVGSNGFPQELVAALNDAARGAAIDAEFREENVKRNHGQFAKQEGSGGGAGEGGKSDPWEVLNRPDPPARPGLAGRALEGTAQALKNYTKADYNVLKEHLSPGSETRKSMAKTLAKLPPAWLKAHLKHEYQHGKQAVGALRALGTGSNPSAEQWKGLGAITTSLLLSTVSFLSHGDPTGAAGHAAGAGISHAASATMSYLAAEFGTTVAEHVATEHGVQAAAGVGRYALAKAGYGGGDAAPTDNDFTDEDIQLLQEYVASLAKRVETEPIDNDALMASLNSNTSPSKDGQRPLLRRPGAEDAALRPRLQRPGAADAEFKESNVQRDEEGKFVAQGGGSGDTKADAGGGHFYKLKYRPPSFSTLPSDVKWDYAEAPRSDYDLQANRPDLPRSKHPFGVIKTERPLTPDEMKSFEIEPVER